VLLITRHLQPALRAPFCEHPTERDTEKVEGQENGIDVELSNGSELLGVKAVPLPGIVASVNRSSMRMLLIPFELCLKS
jgi:hypothetical protein